ncbi:trypsin-like peptidase domain-containing protein [Tabrizicola sp.]|uniref:serine protease n=1 Tax=Tabrizicola sp. TaxID=2005166 RepID=UPI001A44517D|nr:trypsin-like peptidase domain-containing protein [Tabrizicola sp.]MBL9075422.1 peptidoglycan-binding protein [Tabrizicola sp.]
MFRPVALLALLLSALILLQPRAGAAQDDTVWLQVEALPNMVSAKDRAQAYTSLFPDTAGFQLRSGWYGIMIGPYPAAEAAIKLEALKREGQIPADSFIAYSRDFRDQYWPENGDPPLIPATNDAATAEPDPAVDPEPAEAPDETRAEARDSEALLLPEDRKDLQTALQWFGFYASGIDGAFGPGTRNSMAAWQEAEGLEPTGILTTRQRRALLDAWKGELSTFGFTEVVEAESGITVTLPLGLVEFDHYEPPFVHYRAKAEGAPRILLISQPGDQAALYGLYDVLQTLESVPLDGARDRGDRDFRIRGTSATTDTTVFAALKGDRIKGWMLISTPGNEARDARILQVLEQSFKPDGDSVLDPGMVAMDAGTRAGLLSGLEVRKPKLSRTGFFISPEGAVLTTTEAVAECGRVTIDRATEAEVTLTDARSGLALLKPKSPLAPRAVAGFATTPGRPGSEVTVPGYSYEDRLPAPTLTFGTLDDLTGLNGESGLNRLSLQSLPGDAGGAVLDASGAVLGMLLPAAPAGGKQLPAGVAFALPNAEIARLLTPTGVTPLPATNTSALSPAALADTAMGMTALVSCWE